MTEALAIPLPPEPLRFMGESEEEFIAIGDELAGDLRSLARLPVEGHLVDVGCGYGRVAHALLRAGDFRGRYLGLDILPRQIAWCQENFTPLSEGSLRFELVDIKNDRYNPAGRVSPRSVSFDVETGSADVVLLASVFTHMYADDIVHYLGEIRRMLRPEGRCLATAFLLNESWREAHAAGRAAYSMDHELGPHCRYASKEDPLFAIAFDEAWFVEAARAQGLELAEPILNGSWCGRPDGFRWQDYLCLKRLASLH